jgi:hypothetical protein
MRRYENRQVETWLEGVTVFAENVRRTGEFSIAEHTWYQTNLQSGESA